MPDIEYHARPKQNTNAKH